jgi:AraC family transcriptional regulator, ethanolamine operon transcriptional activator
MSAATQNPGIAHVRVSYFNPDELLDVVKGAQLVHRLTGGPSFRADLDHVHLDGFACDRGAYAMPVFVEGSFGRDTICLGTMLTADRPTLVNGKRTGQGDLQIYAEGCELEYNAGPNSTWAACLVTRQELQAAAMALVGGPLKLNSSGVATVRPARHALEAATRAIHRMFSISNAHVATERELSHQRELAVDAYARAIASAGEFKTNSSPGSSRSRRQIAERVRCWLEMRTDEPYSSRAVCEIAGCSERYVEMVFKERYGLSPLKWHLVQRLNQARIDLLKGEACNGGVTAVATRRGFYELSRFAAMYRNLFGELPSKTARRVAS